MVQELELDLLSDAQPSRVARSIVLSPRSEERSSEQRLIRSLTSLINRLKFDQAPVRRTFHSGRGLVVRAQNVKFNEGTLGGF